MPEENATAPSTHEVSPEYLLDKLIGILVHSPESSAAWLDAISTKIEKQERTIGTIAKIVTTGADLEVPKAITYKIIDRIVKEDGVRYTDEQKTFLVEGIYGEREKWRENERRCIAGLPRLPLD
jgi:hypothetical protein